MSEQKERFKHLETQVDTLIRLCEDLKRHNQALLTREAQLLDERASLMRKNDIAKNKVEAMITRLKALEREA